MLITLRHHSLQPPNGGACKTIFLIWSASFQSLSPWGANQRGRFSRYDVIGDLRPPMTQSWKVVLLVLHVLCQTNIYSGTVHKHHHCGRRRRRRRRLSGAAVVSEFHFRSNDRRQLLDFPTCRRANCSKLSATCTQCSTLSLPSVSRFAVSIRSEVVGRLALHEFFHRSLTKSLHSFSRPHACVCVPFCRVWK